MTDNTPTPALVAAFENTDRAHDAVKALEEAGFPHDAVGFVSPADTRSGSSAVAGGSLVDAPSHDARDALNGAITGGMVGGVLAAAVSILVPGIGPLLAGGVLAAFFGGTLAGSAVGGLLGALRGLGLTEERALEFEHHVQAGKALVVVQPGGRVSQAEDILCAHGGIDLHVESRPIVHTSATDNSSTGTQQH